jgi:small subunit ribosomal protein S2
VSREEIPVHEANLLKIPVIAMVDTNCNPKNIDYVIPANDDAIRGIQLIVSIVAQAVSEGINLRKDKEADLQAAEAEAQLPEELRDQLSDEDLLGESTLAKMKQEDQETTEEPEMEAAEEAGEELAEEAGEETNEQESDEA